MTVRVRCVILVLSLVVPAQLFAAAIDHFPPKTHTLEGAVVGLTLGISAGAITDGILSGTVSSDSNGRTAAALLIIPFGAGLIGAGIGALIGHSMHSSDDQPKMIPVLMVDPTTGAKGMMIQGTF